MSDVRTSKVAVIHDSFLFGIFLTSHDQGQGSSWNLTVIVGPIYDERTHHGMRRRMLSVV